MIEFRGVTKVYAQATRDVVALDDVSIAIGRGEFVSIIGPSGSGKSTFLHLAGALDLPTRGDVSIDGSATTRLSDRDLTLIRRRCIGFVFQFFNLIPTLTVLENVALPLLLDNLAAREANARAQALVERVGLVARRDHRPEELSGGEQQRVAIARSLVTDPVILLADEPTGNLDSATGEDIMSVVRSVAANDSKTVVIVTHNPAVARHAQRIVTLRDGRIDKVESGAATP